MSGLSQDEFELIFRHLFAINSQYHYTETLTTLSKNCPWLRTSQIELLCSTPTQYLHMKTLFPNCIARLGGMETVLQKCNDGGSGALTEIVKVENHFFMARKPETQAKIHVEAIEREFAIMTRLAHVSGMTGVPEPFSNVRGGFLIQGFPLTLQDYIEHERKFTDDQSCEFIKALAATLLMVHSSHVIHANLNPTNILLGEDGTVSIVGWEFASSNGEHCASWKAQLPQDAQNFCAPEVQQDRLYARKESDIYSFGKVLEFACPSSVVGSLVQRCTDDQVMNRITLLNILNELGVDALPLHVTSQPVQIPQLRWMARALRSELHIRALLEELCVVKARLSVLEQR